MRPATRFALPLLLCAVLTAATPPIEGDAILEHVKYLSSDELGGRANGSEGLERAADYIARQLQSAGLRPAAGAGGWYQPFDMVAGLEIGSGNALTLRAARTELMLTLGTSYFPLAVTPNGDGASPSIDLDGAPLVFAGYGIAAQGHRYDDYDGIDVRGKVVLIFTHEPQEDRRDSRLNGSRPLSETTLYAKAAAARSRGARALLVVSDPSHRTDPADFDQFLAESDAEDHGIPVLRLRRLDVQPLLQAWRLDELAAQIDRDLVPRSRALDGATVTYREFLSRKRREVRNVVGVLPGTDPARAAESIVIGAHYDHVGVGGRFSMTPERTGEIHNGADDNASGTASLIEMAKAAAADPTRFPRSLVFVAFAAEERGLLGSAHYAEHAALPIAGTVAMINLDMVGRANGRVNVSGLERYARLEQLLQDAAQGGGLAIRREGPGPGRSDDANFLNRRIPAFHFFTGFHDDYHGPGDDWEKLDAPGTARVARLALEFAARIAAEPERPTFAD